MTTTPLLCKQANQMDLVDYLGTLGFQPQRIRIQDYWYLSPLRVERTPSFKVNRRLNVWYDHGLGKGGTLVDFGILFYGCTVNELLSKLTMQNGPHFCFHQQQKQSLQDSKVEAIDNARITVISKREICDPTLRKYLQKRNIPEHIAKQFCKEVIFELYGKKHVAIGFENGKGGFELRNSYFKGSSSPKEPRLIKGSSNDELSVFEGFFSFLSFQTIQKNSASLKFALPGFQADKFVLNSAAFFEKNRSAMEGYNKIHLFLDRDSKGIECTQQALKWSDNYLDQSKYYRSFKDLNEYLVNSLTNELRQYHRRGRQL